MAVVLRCNHGAFKTLTVVGDVLPDDNKTCQIQVTISRFFFLAGGNTLDKPSKKCPTNES